MLSTPNQSQLESRSKEKSETTMTSQYTKQSQARKLYYPHLFAYLFYIQVSTSRAKEKRTDCTAGNQATIPRNALCSASVRGSCNGRSTSYDRSDPPRDRKSLGRSSSRRRWKQRALRRLLVSPITRVRASLSPETEDRARDACVCVLRERPDSGSYRPLSRSANPTANARARA